MFKVIRVICAKNGEGLVQQNLSKAATRNPGHVMFHLLAL